MNYVQGVGFVMFILGAIIGYNMENGPVITGLISGGCLAVMWHLFEDKED